METLIFLAAGLALFATVNGIGTQCVTTDVCYSLSIPDITVSTGSGDIYVQISGPSTYSWIGVGQGTEMAGSNFMIIYADSTGSNVTLSPRLSSGNVQPTYNSAAKMTLLAGSGISNGVMTANILCSSCSSWTGGSADLSSSSTSWIYGFKTGNELSSDSQSATIMQHDSDGYGNFKFDSTAQGGSDSNPFLSSSNSTAACDTATSTASTASTTTAAADNSGTLTTSAVVSTSISFTVTSSAATSTITAKTTSVSINHISSTYTSKQEHKTMGQQGRRTVSLRREAPLAKRGETAEMIVRRQTSSTCTLTSSSGNSYPSQDSSFNVATTRMRVITIHAVCACLAFTFFFPIGGILIRVAQFNNTLWIHVGMQIAAYLLYTAAVGMGIWITKHPNSGQMKDKHPIIGLFLFCLLLFQAPAGWMHHEGYKKYGRRTVWSHIHLWIGRVAITLGILNAGFGFMLSGTSGSGPITYVVLATLIWVAYVLSIVYGEHKRLRKVVKLVTVTNKPGNRISRLSFMGITSRNIDEQNIIEPVTMRSSQERHEIQPGLPMPPMGYFEGGGLRSHPLQG